MTCRTERSPCPRPERWVLCYLREASIRFHQSGGAVTGPIRLTVGSDNPNAPATYEMSGGSLDMQGCTVTDNGILTISHASSDIRFSSFFNIATGGRLHAVPGATIHLLETAWFNHSSQPQLMENMRHVTFVYEGSPGFFQAAGRDLGPHITGFTSNFAQGGIQVGSDAQTAVLALQDHLDNVPDDPNPEVVYVKHLILSPGSKLYLQGLTVYCYRFTDNGGTVIANGGQLIQVPVLPGDSNGDDAVNVLDIAPFVQSSSTPTPTPPRTPRRPAGHERPRPRRRC